MSFRLKMIMGIACVEAVFLLAILMSSLAVLTRSEHQALATRAGNDARLFGTAAADALISEDLSSLRRITRAVVHTRGVVYAAAWDGSDRLLAAAGRGYHRRNTTAVYAIRIDGVPYGKVAVWLSDHGFGAVLAAARARIVAIALGELLLVGLVSWLLGSYLMRQIARIEAGTARIARGEFGFLLPVSGGDELARMVAGFNAMSIKLQELQAEADRRYQETQALNEKLEGRVQERTLALATANRELEYLAMHDPLTSLPNRILLQDRLAQAIRAARRAPAPFALMVMDLDGFKDVNDTLGHAAGDLLLQETAMRVTKTLRQSDTAARLGGDEFALLLPTVAGPVDAEAVARKLLRAVEEPVSVGGQTVQVTASLGVALFPVHGDDVGGLLRRADRAMYEAKRGRLGLAIFKKDMEDEGDDRLRLQGDLQRAIANGELILYYQPKIDLASGKISGAEALVRWQHPTLGLLAPDRFIPLAERTRLIGPLTFYVVRAAARQARAWRDAGRPLAIAVNISAINLEDAQFADHVAQILQDVGVDPDMIECEVTETALMRDPDLARKTIEALSKIGVRVSIDDFGTGYSSMTYLRKLAVAAVKIDKSFVIDMGVSRNDTVIVRSVIDLGHNLGLKVIGEGVENAETMAALTSLGCDFAQGYHLTRPLDAEAFDAWRRTHS